MITKTHIIMGAVIIALIAILSISECKHLKTQANNAMQLLSLTDTIKITKNRLGQETAHTGAIVAEYSAFKNFQFAVTDSLGKALKKAVNGRTLNAAVATQELRVRAELPTSETLGGVTAIKTDSGGVKTLRYDTCRPLYTLVFDSLDPYRRGTIIAGRDSFKVDLKFPEQLTFRTEESIFHLFKPNTYTSTYTNSNPYVEITGLKTFTMKCDCKTKSLISFGFGSLGGAFAGFAIGRATK
jgi:hypothetical protein